MKLKQVIGVCVFLLLGQSAFAVMESQPAKSTSVNQGDSASTPTIGSELSSLPASITRYNASRNIPDSPASDDFQTYGGELCKLPGFKCEPVGLKQTWAELWHNEHEREIVMRLNRTNVALRYRKWIVVPKHLGSTNYMDLSPLPDSIPPLGHELLIVDLRVFAFGAYDANGNLVYWGPATGGQTYCPDHTDCRSATGEFKIYRMKGEDCMSSKYPLDRGGGAPMPYCMYYFKGYVIHGSTLAGFLNGSHGCIRLFYSDAKWLNENFVKLGTEVIVKR